MDRLAVARERVYDPVLRLIHGWNALLVMLLVLTGQTADWLDLSWEVPAIWRMHLWFGYALVVGLAARLAWGVVGPRQARWARLWHPRAWRVALRESRFLGAPEAFGHHPLASGAHLGVYALLLAMAASGLALAAIDQNTGPLYALLGHDAMLKAGFRLPHEWLQYPILLFIVVHLAMLIQHERRHGLPMAQAMVSGYQYLDRK